MSGQKLAHPDCKIYRQNIDNERSISVIGIDFEKLRVMTLTKLVPPGEHGTDRDSDAKYLLGKLAEEIKCKVGTGSHPIDPRLTFTKDRIRIKFRTSAIDSAFVVDSLHEMLVGQYNLEVSVY